MLDSGVAAGIGPSTETWGSFNHTSHCYQQSRLQAACNELSSASLRI